MFRLKKRIGHHLFAGGAFIWAAVLVAISLAPASLNAIPANQVFTLSNQARINNGLSAYSLNSNLQSSAQAKAQHMLSNGYFDHVAPDGTQPWYFFTAAGYDFSAAGENLAAGNQDASAVVQGWLNSPSHRDNLLSSSFSEVGYGSVYVGDWQFGSQTVPDTYFVVAHYATPTAPVQSDSEAEPITEDPASQSQPAATTPDNSSPPSAGEASLVSPEPVDNSDPEQNNQANLVGETNPEQNTQNDQSETNTSLSLNDSPVVALFSKADSPSQIKKTLQTVSILAASLMLAGLIFERHWIARHINPRFHHYSH